MALRRTAGGIALCMGEETSPVLTAGAFHHSWPIVEFVVGIYRFAGSRRMPAEDFGQEVREYSRGEMLGLCASRHGSEVSEPA